MLRQQAANQFAITDVTADEDVVRVRAQRGQRVDIAGIGQFVEIDDAEAALRHEAEHEIAADESGAAGDQDRFHPEKVFMQGKASKVPCGA
jgi:hypothetical protein